MKSDFCFFLYEMQTLQKNHSKSFFPLLLREFAYTQHKYQ